MERIIGHQKNIIINRKTIVKKGIYFVFAFLSVFYFVNGLDFISGNDIANYLNYANLSFRYLMDHFNHGLWQVVINEPFFLLVNTFFNEFFSAEGVIAIIASLSLTLFYYSFGKLSNANMFIIICTTFLSQININFSTHIRQGLALSIYLYSFTKKDKYAHYFLKVIACFTHTSVLFLVLFEIIEKVLYWLKIRSFKIYKKAIISIAIVVVLVSIPYIASFIGDRRGQRYSLFQNTSIGGGWIFWLLFGILYLMYNRTQKFYNICIYGILFYLLGYFIFPSSVRVFENMIPFMVCDICNNKNKWYRNMAMAVLLCFAVLTL